MTLTRRVTEREELEGILGHRNAWPDVPIVKIETYDLSEAAQAYTFGSELGYAHGTGALRQPRADNLPRDVREVLQKYDMEFYLNETWWNLMRQYGEHKDSGVQNLRAIFPARRSYNFETKRQEFTSPGVVVILGCKHEYKATARGNCWQESTCQLCGHTFEIDSSG